MNKRLTTLSLSEPGHPAVPLGASRLDAALGGLRRGALHEVFAADAGAAGAATGFAAGLAACLSGGKRLLWIRQDFAAREYGALSPLGLLELGFDPARVILVAAPDALAALRAAQEGLACAGLGAVIAELYGEPRILDLTASRRLGLAAAKTGVTGLLLRHHARPAPGAAETRWRVRPLASAGDEIWGHARFEASLFRNRHGMTGQWLLEWRDGHFHDADETTHSGAVVSAPADRPHPARRHSA